MLKYTAKWQALIISIMTFCSLFEEQCLLEMVTDSFSTFLQGGYKEACGDITCESNSGN